MDCSRFIEAEKAQQRSVKRACELLVVSVPPATLPGPGSPVTAPARTRT